VALAMAKRPETRYQDGDQFAADLRAVLAELGGAPAGASGATGRMQATTAAAAPQAGGHDKTVVLATTAAASAQFEKTVVHHTQAVKPSDDTFQRTAVHQAPASASPRDDFEKTAVHQARPADTANDAFEKTAVHQRTQKPDNKPGPAAPTVPDVEI
jgi:hypothetical protein